MQKKNDNDNVAAGTGAPVVGDIDFGAAKQPIADLETLAAVLDYELYQKEWFVTGNVNPVYFAESFRFQDPDVTLDGVDAYAKGVSTLFDQSISRAEIIQTVVNPQIGDNVITCTWRLSGRVNIGPGDGLTIKPYIVFTDFFVQDGLVVRQEDRFDLPQWDILLSSLFPFLIGKVSGFSVCLRFEMPPPTQEFLLPQNTRYRSPSHRRLQLSHGRCQNPRLKSTAASRLLTSLGSSST